MRAHDTGRTALLQPLRPELRREALPATAPQPARRGGLQPVREPGALDTPAKDIPQLAARRPPPPSGTRPAALLYISVPARCPPAYASVPAVPCPHRAHGRRCLVVLFETARLAPEADPGALEVEKQ